MSSSFPLTRGNKMDNQNIISKIATSGDEEALLSSPESVVAEKTITEEIDDIAMEAEALTSNTDNEPMKRLSGAQRRKAAIERAKALGEPIRHRKRNPKKQRDANQERSSQTPSGSVSEGEIAGGSGVPAKTPSSKRQRSDGSTPNSQSKVTVKKPCTDANAVGKETFKEALKGIKMAITPQDFPETRLTEEQAEEIQMALLGQIQPGEEGTGPQFNNCYFDKGAVILSCKNEETKSWLITMTPNLKPWEGAKLNIGTAKEVLNAAKVLMWAPKPFNTKPQEEILKLLKTQNKGLKTEDWRVINSVSEPNGRTLIMLIDETSLKTLRNLDMKPCLGLRRATFRCLSAPTPTGHDGASTSKCPEAGPSKPPAQ